MQFFTAHIGSLEQGNVFTPICHSFCSKGGACVTGEVACVAGEMVCMAGVDSMAEGHA